MFQKLLRACLVATALLISLPSIAQEGCIIQRDASWTMLARNDDGSSAGINLGFAFDMYGTSYTKVFINTNGNLTFNNPLAVFSPFGFPLDTAMVAPFWSDIDTRPATCGAIYYKLYPTRLVVLWDSVGYYDQKCILRNTFQAVIGTVNDPVIGLGQNVLFNYGDMQWTTGEASGSGTGFGGTAATVGINKGDNVHYVQIGRFSKNNDTYDGGGGAEDGVSYLDSLCFAFNVSNALNIPPSFSGLPTNNTINLVCGNTTSFTIKALGPEVNQTVSTTLNTNGTCGVSATISNGLVSTTNLTVSALPCNVGTNVITLRAIDSGATTRDTTFINITINVTKPPVTATPGGPTTFCQGGAVLLSSSAGASYQWKLNTIDISGATSQTYSAAASGSYTVQTTYNSGCAATSAPITVLVNPLPLVSITPGGPTSFCQGGSVTLTANASAGSSLLWSDNTTGPSITVSASGSYSVTATFPTGCSRTVSQAVTVNQPPPTPIISANGPTTFCEGSMVTLSTSRSAPSNTAFITAGTPTGSSTICDCPAGYVAVGYMGRTGSWLDQFQLDCRKLNNDGTIDATPVYTTSNGVSIGGSPNAGSSFTGTTALTGLLIDNAVTGTGNFLSGITGRGQTTAYIAANGANGSGPATLPRMGGVVLTSNLGTLTVPNGNVVVGMGAYNNDYYSKGVALRYMPIGAVTGNNISWSNTATGPSATIDSSGTYTVTITDANGCSSTSAPTTITVNTPPTITCPNNVALSAEAGLCAATATYPDATATGSPAPVVNYSQVSGTSFNVGTTVVTATATNICGTQTCTFNVVVTDNELPTVITKPATVYLDAAGGVSIAVGDIDDGSTDNCSIQSYALSQTSFDCTHVGTQTVTLSVTDIHGNTGTGTATVTVIDNIAPTVTAPVAIAACDKSANATNNYTLTATGADNCSFTFSYAITGATTGSGTGSSVTQDFNVGTSTITWTVTDASLNTASASTTVTIWELPTVSIANQTNICEQNTIYVGYGVTSLTLQASGSGGTPAYSYSWSPSGATTSSVTVSPSASTSYTVTLTDAHLCTATATVQVKVKDVRCGHDSDKVMVCHYGTTAICISPSAVPTHLTTHGDCLGDCSSSSARMVGNTGHSGQEAGHMTVYPNPAHDKLNVTLYETGSPYRSYTITDISGRVLLSQKLADGVHADLITIDIRSLVPGIYIIRAIRDDGFDVAKFTVE